jgi:hypothetical protein
VSRRVAVVAFPKIKSILAKGPPRTGLCIGSLDGLSVQSVAVWLIAV